MCTLLVQYATDFMYNGVMSEVYMSSSREEEKNNNYTLIVRKDNKVRGCGFGGFGSAEKLVVLYECP